MKILQIISLLFFMALLSGCGDDGDVDVAQTKFAAEQCNEHFTGSGTPLHRAICNGDLAEAKRMLKYRPDSINARTTFGGYTALHAAAYMGNVKVVKWLIKQGLPVNTISGSSETALHIAAGGGNVKMAKWLVKQGLDVKDEGILQSAITGNLYAVAAGRDVNTEMMKYLKSKGAK